MKSIVPFIHEQFGEVRVVDLDGEIWFVATDVARVLGYADPKKAIKQHCKKAKTLIISGGANHPPSKSLPKIIPESDFYRLVFRSNLDGADVIVDWVVEDVLPTIRKTGQYSTNHGGKFSGTLPEFDSAVKLAGILGFEGNAQIIAANNAYRSVVGVDVQELFGATHLLAAKKELTLTPSDIGKEFKISGVKVNKILEDMGFQVGKRNHKGKLLWTLTEKGKPYAEVYDTGKQYTNGTPIKQVKWYEEVIELVNDFMAEEK